MSQFQIPIWKLCFPYSDRGDSPDVIWGIVYFLGKKITQGIISQAQRACFYELMYLPGHIPLDTSKYRRGMLNGTSLSLSTQTRNDTGLPARDSVPPALRSPPTRTPIPSAHCLCLRGSQSYLHSVTTSLTLGTTCTQSKHICFSIPPALHLTPGFQYTLLLGCCPQPPASRSRYHLQSTSSSHTWILVTL